MMDKCEKCKKDKNPNEMGKYRGAKLCISCELEAVGVVNKAFDDWLNGSAMKRG